MATIFITGATDGIGLALARLYAAQGHRLLLLGRRPPASLSDPLFSEATYCQADLAETDAAARVAAWLRGRGVAGLDLLIHNAGGGYHGAIADQSDESIDTLIQVNFLSPVRLTHVLQPWLAAARGKVVFVSSVVTALPTPDYAVYGATKAALEGFARSLRVEWAGSVAVQVVRPGATRTGMHAKIGLTRDILDWERFPPATQVATQLARAVAGNRPVVTLGAANRLLTTAGRVGRPLLDPLMRKRTLDGALREPEAARPRCLVTGFADGIGLALALAYARAGYDIVGVDVDERRAAESAALLRAGRRRRNGADRADLAAVDGPGQVVAGVAETGRLLDVVVHNAGISAVGRFGSLPLPPQEAVVALNLRAPLLLTAGLLHDRLLAQEAAFVFLSSLSFYSGYPGAAVYGATKDGVANYARSLQAVSRSRRVATVFPGPTRTAHARRYSPDNSREARRMPPADVAAAVLRGVARGRTRIIPGAANRLLALAGQVAPRLMEAAMRRAIFDLLPPEPRAGAGEDLDV